MGDDNNPGEAGVELADAISMLRSALLSARAAGARSEVQLPVESMTVQLHVAATKRTDGKAGFRVPVVNAELGGSKAWQHEALQTVTVVFGAPVDRDGNPVKVAEASDALMG